MNALVFFEWAEFLSAMLLKLITRRRVKIEFLMKEGYQ